MGYIKIDTETGEVIDYSDESSGEQPEKEKRPYPDPQPATQEITEDMLKKEEERRRKKRGEIIDSLTPEELENLIRRNRIEDLFRKKKEIGQA